MGVYTINKFREPVRQDTLIKALDMDLSKPQTIAFAGAGGKTSSIYQLGQELASEGKKVIITTTTHMMQPEKYGVLEENKEKIQEMLATHNIAVVGNITKNEKITGVSEHFFEWMTSVADYVLVEADGSKRLPLKAPNLTEPVWPKHTDMAVIVMGLSSLNQPVEKICHRPEIVTRLLNCSMEHRIQPEDIALLIKKGYCDNLNVTCKILMNQCDSEEQLKYAMKIADYLTEYSCMIRGYIQ